MRWSGEFMRSRKESDMFKDFLRNVLEYILMGTSHLDRDEVVSEYEVEVEKWSRMPVSCLDISMFGW